MNKVFNFFIPIIGLCFWIFVIDGLAKRKASGLLSINQCYEIDGNPYQVISKENNFYVLKNYRNKNIIKKSYGDTSWYYTSYKKRSCSNSRSIASINESYSDSVLLSWYKQLKANIK